MLKTRVKLGWSDGSRRRRQDEKRKQKPGPNPARREPSTECAQGGMLTIYYISTPPTLSQKSYSHYIISKCLKYNKKGLITLGHSKLRTLPRSSSLTPTDTSPTLMGQHQ